jgi:A/G-specific adenine glycosylase
MLQQTQVERVIPKYSDFLGRFPSMAALANASLGEVLRLWQGLGYNRRAKMLHECAKAVKKEYGGKLPRDIESLRRLPGIGPYTAGAVAAFAHNMPVVMIETNIRTAYLHHFFKDTADVSDRDILPLIERTLDRKAPREWYAALMDYGSHVKAIEGNANRRSRHYTRQSRFDGSDRQVRGAIIRMLSGEPALTEGALSRALTFKRERIAAQLKRLKDEGLVTYQKRRWSLPGA